MSAPLRLKRTGTYSNSGEGYRVWEFLADCPSLPTGRGIACDPPHAATGDELWEEDDDDLTPFRLKRNGKTIGDPERWQVAHLLASADTNPPAPDPETEEPPARVTRTAEEREHDRRYVLLLLKDLEKLLDEARTRIERMAAPAAPVITPEMERARARLQWQEEPWPTMRGASLLLQDVPEVGASAGDILVFARQVEDRPKMYGRVRELEPDEYEALRLAQINAAAPLFRDLYPSPRVGYGPDHAIARFVGDRRAWGLRGKSPHSRLLLVRPFGREESSAPVAASSDSEAAFELLMQITEGSR